MDDKDRLDENNVGVADNGDGSYTLGKATALAGDFELVFYRLGVMNVQASMLALYAKPSPGVMLQSFDPTLGRAKAVAALFGVAWAPVEPPPHKPSSSHRSAYGVHGYLLREATSERSFFFRVYEYEEGGKATGEFEDYDIDHDDLKIAIVDRSARLLPKKGGKPPRIVSGP